MAIVYVVYSVPVITIEDKSVKQNHRVFVNEQHLYDWCKDYKTEYNINDENTSNTYVRIREIEEIRVSKEQHDYVEKKRGCWKSDLQKIEKQNLKSKIKQSEILKSL